MVCTHPPCFNVRREQQGDIDVIEYVEAYMEVLTALGDAENDLYSANFADYSGGGGTKVSPLPLEAHETRSCFPRVVLQRTRHTMALRRARTNGGVGAVALQLSSWPLCRYLYCGLPQNRCRTTRPAEEPCLCRAC